MGKNISLEQSVALEKMTLPPGTYTLSFQAQSLNLESSQWNNEAYGDQVVNLYKSKIKDLGYGLPIKFYITPPRAYDSFATTQEISQVIINSEAEDEYKIEFTLKRRSMINFCLDVDLPWNGGLAMMIARHQFKGELGRKEREAMERKYIDIRDYDLPMVRLRNMKIKGPYNVQLHPLSFGEGNKVTTTEVGAKFRKLHSLLGLKNNIIYSYIFKDFQVEKLKYEDAYRNAMNIFFMSPPFLTIHGDGNKSEELVRYSSYSLHKSAPTKDFVQQFKNAKKTGKAEFFSQWLIKQNRFRRFINAFSYQWLQLGEIKNNIPDEQDFSVFYAKNFKDAYRIELELFMLNLFRENRPVRELIDANYSFLNEGLKEFYNNYDTNARLSYREKPPMILESNFEKTEFADPLRGGLLGMGAFLTTTGNGVDPLPIKRATWILDKLLDSPLPPPPDTVDLSTFEVNKSENLKDRLAIHSKDRACNTCHKRIDPLAILMDYYDTIGGINENYAADAVRINSQKIRGVDELKVYLSFYEPAIARSFCKALLNFMLGRDMGIKDEEKLDAIIQENTESGFKTADLYRSIIKHYFL